MYTKCELLKLINPAQNLANRPAHLVSNPDSYMAVTVTIHQITLHPMCLMGLSVRLIAWSYRWPAKQLPGQSP